MAEEIDLNNLKGDYFVYEPLKDELTHPKEAYLNVLNQDLEDVTDDIKTREFRSNVNGLMLVRKQEELQNILDSQANDTMLVNRDEMEARFLNSGYEVLNEKETLDRVFNANPDMNFYLDEDMEGSQIYGMEVFSVEDPLEHNKNENILFNESNQNLNVNQENISNQYYRYFFEVKNANDLPLLYNSSRNLQDIGQKEFINPNTYELDNFQDYKYNLESINRNQILDEKRFLKNYDMDVELYTDFEDVLLANDSSPEDFFAERGIEISPTLFEGGNSNREKAVIVTNKHNALEVMSVNQLINGVKKIKDNEDTTWGITPKTPKNYENLLKRVQHNDINDGDSIDLSQEKELLYDKHKITLESLVDIERQVNAEDSPFETLDDYLDHAHDLQQSLDTPEERKLILLYDERTDEAEILSPKELKEAVNNLENGRNTKTKILSDGNLNLNFEEAERGKETHEVRSIDVQKVEQLKNVYKELNSSEIDLFKQKAEEENESLDNHFSDSFGNSRYEEKEKYEEMKNTLSKESVNKVEKKYEENKFLGSSIKILEKHLNEEEKFLENEHNANDTQPDLINKNEKQKNNDMEM